MTQPLVQIPESAIIKRLTHGFEDEFNDTIDAHRWTTVATDSGTALTGDSVGGEVTLIPSDGSVADNDEIYLARPNEAYLFAENKPIEFECDIQYAEANVDDANVIVGLADAVAANLLQDDGAGPKATMSGYGFYKVDGGTNWNIYISVGTGQVLVELTAANSLRNQAATAGGAAGQRLRATFAPLASDKGNFNFYIDGRHVYRSIDFDYSSSPLEMQFVIGAKNGFTNNENILSDYAWAYQKR